MNERKCQVCLILTSFSSVKFIHLYYMDKLSIALSNLIMLIFSMPRTLDPSPEVSKNKPTGIHFSNCSRFKEIINQHAINVFVPTVC